MEDGLRGGGGGGIINVILLLLEHFPLACSPNYKKYFLAVEVFQGTLTLQKNLLSSRQKKSYGTNNECKEILDFLQGIGAYMAL